MTYKGTKLLAMPTPSPEIARPTSISPILFACAHMAAPTSRGAAQNVSEDLRPRVSAKGPVRKEPTAAKAKMMLTIALFNGAFVAISSEDDMAFKAGLTIPR